MDRELREAYLGTECEQSHSSLVIDAPSISFIEGETGNGSGSINGAGT